MAVVGFSIVVRVGAEDGTAVQVGAGDDTEVGIKDGTLWAIVLSGVRDGKAVGVDVGRSSTGNEGVDDIIRLGAGVGR